MLMINRKILHLLAKRSPQVYLLQNQFSREDFLQDQTPYELDRESNNKKMPIESQFQGKRKVNYSRITSQNDTNIPERGDPLEQQEEKSALGQFKYLSDYLNNYKRNQMNLKDEDLLQMAVKITNYFKIQRQQKYSECLQDLYMVVEDLTKINYFQLPLQSNQSFIADYIDLFKFQRTLLKITNSNLVLRNFQKKLASRLAVYCNKINSLTKQELIEFYRAISFGNFIKCGQISFQILNRLQKDKQQGIQSINIQLIENIVRATQRRRILSLSQVRLLSFLVIKIESLSNELPKETLIRIGTILNNHKLHQICGNVKILTLLNAIYSKMHEIIKNGELDLHEMKFLNQGGNSGNQIFENIYHLNYNIIIKTIEKFLVEKKRIETEENEQKIESNMQADRSTVSNKLKRMKNAIHFTEVLLSLKSKIKLEWVAKTHQQTLIELLTCGFEQLQPNWNQRNEKNLLFLIRMGFFGQNLPLVNPVLKMPNLHFNWSFPVAYALKGFSYPPELFHKYLDFNWDGIITFSFMKKCISIAYHKKLNPNDEKYSTASQQLLDIMKQITLKQESLKAFFKIAITFIDESRQFFKLYEDILIPQIAQTQLIKTEQFQSYFHKFCIYNFSMENDPALISRFLDNLNIDDLLFLLMLDQRIKVRQFNNIFLHLTIKKIRNNQTATTRNNDMWYTAGELLVNSFNKLKERASEISIDLLWGLAYALVEHYDKIPRHDIEIVIYAFQKLLAGKGTGFKSTTYYKNFLASLIRKLTIFQKLKLSPHFIIQIIREGLQNNFIFFNHYDFSQLNLNFFSEDEKIKIDGLIKSGEGKIKSLPLLAENLVYFVRIKNISSQLSENHEKTLQILDEMPSKELQKLLINFSIEPTEFSLIFLNRIIEKYVSFPIDQSSDALGVISNLELYGNSVEENCVKLLTNFIEYYQSHMKNLPLLTHIELLGFCERMHLKAKNYELALVNHILTNGKLLPEEAAMLCFSTLSQMNFEFRKEDIAGLIKIYQSRIPADCLQLLVLYEHLFEQKQEYEKIVEDIIIEEEKFKRIQSPLSLLIVTYHKKSYPKTAKAFERLKGCTFKQSTLFLKKTKEMAQVFEILKAQIGSTFEDIQFCKDNSLYKLKNIVFGLHESQTNILALNLLSRVAMSILPNGVSILLERELARTPFQIYDAIYKSTGEHGISTEAHERILKKLNKGQ